MLSSFRPETRRQDGAARKTSVEKVRLQNSLGCCGEIDGTAIP